MKIETEIRSFISKEKFDELLDFFKKNASLEKEDYQETFYFDCDEDLRIQRNNFFSKIWMKKGQIHDDYREEIEIKFDRDELEKMCTEDIKIKEFKNLEQKLESLNVEITPKEEFNKKFLYYKENWKSLV